MINNNVTPEEIFLELQTIRFEEMITDPGGPIIEYSEDRPIDQVNYIDSSFFCHPGPWQISFTILLPRGQKARAIISLYPNDIPVLYVMDFVDTFLTMTSTLKIEIPWRIVK